MTSEVHQVHFGHHFQPNLSCPTQNQVKINCQVHYGRHSLQNKNEKLRIGVFTAVQNSVHRKPPLLLCILPILLGNTVTYNRYFVQGKVCRIYFNTYYSKRIQSTTCRLINHTNSKQPIRHGRMFEKRTYLCCGKRDLATEDRHECHYELEYEVVGYLHFLNHWKILWMSY